MIHFEAKHQKSEAKTKVKKQKKKQKKRKNAKNSEKSEKCEKSDKIDLNFASLCFASKQKLLK
jgi:hypothetical protein